MHKIFKHILLTVMLSCIIVQFPLQISYSQDEQSQEDWVLIWYDDFEGDTIDTTKWRVEDAALIKNNELQYYSPEDVYLEDGYLVLRSRENQMGGRDYTSGLVETKGLFTPTYGFFEINAKLPRGKGIWPAHWMMNAVGTWPPEIDIMEFLGHETNKVHMTNHFGIYPNNKQEGGAYVGPDFSEDFHTFGLEWEPDVLRWYIDGEERFSTENNVPKVPFYLILNTAVGGNWPGRPNETTEFPQYHYIDYVRVYRKNVPGKAFLVSFAKNGKIVVNPDRDNYPLGTVVKLVAEADFGYRFKSWGADIESVENPIDVTLDANTTVTALFEEDPDVPPLISQGKEVKVSSAENNALRGSNVVDGNLGTRWSSDFLDPQWISIDLGQSYDIAAVKLYWEAAYAHTYDIQVSDDAQDWTTVKTMDDHSSGVVSIVLDNATGRYIRMLGKTRATKYGYSLFEMEVYGK